MGTVLIHNIVGLLKDAPNSDEGKQLIDFILSERVNNSLSFQDMWLMTDIVNTKSSNDMSSENEFKAMEVDFEKVNRLIKPVDECLQEIFLGIEAK